MVMTNFSSSPYPRLDPAICHCISTLTGGTNTGLHGAGMDGLGMGSLRARL